MDVLTPLLTISKRRRRLPQLPMCERRLPQSSTGKRRLPQLPMRDVAKPRRFCRPPRRHLAWRPGAYQNGRRL